MNPKKLKKIRHNQHKQEFAQMKKQRHLDTMKKLENGSFQNLSYGLGLDLGMPWKDISHPDRVYNYRRTVVDHLLNTKPGKHNSRLSLAEYDEVIIEGYVSDYRKDQYGHDQILIDQPIVDQARFQQETTFKNIGRKLDSHIWIEPIDIISIVDGFKGIPTLSVGDTIYLKAHVNSYKKYRHGMIHYKYGLKRLSLIASGIPVVGHHMTYIDNYFNRNGDWILKMPHLKTETQIAEMNKDEHKAYNQNRKQYQVKHSIYPSYYERMHKNQKGN